MVYNGVFDADTGTIVFDLTANAAKSLMQEGKIIRLIIPAVNTMDENNEHGCYSEYEITDIIDYVNSDQGDETYQDNFYYGSAGAFTYLAEGDSGANLGKLCIDIMI